MPATASIASLLAAQEKDRTYVSFEFFPPRSDKAEETLLNVSVPDFVAQKAVFLNMTWGAGGSTSGKTMALCKQIQEAHPNVPVNMHLTCINMPQGLIKDALEFAKDNSIRNIFALRGDPPAGKEFKANEDGFECALDLVKYIKANYGDLFCITVSGYPEGHPSALSPDGSITEEKLKAEFEYLKAKVDAGASLVITQLFYDVSIFIKFVKRCREAGITVPIIPGMLPISSYAGLTRMVNLCKTYVPAEMKAKIEELKEDSDALKAFGVEQNAQMIKDIVAADIGANNFHFYTINATESTFNIMKATGLFTEQ